MAIRPTGIDPSAQPAKRPAPFWQRLNTFFTFPLQSKPLMYSLLLALSPLAFTTALAAQDAPAAEATAEAPAPVWPFEASDVPVDPAFGPGPDNNGRGAPLATVDNVPLRGCVAHRRHLRPHAHSLRSLKNRKGTLNDNNPTGNIPS